MKEATGELNITVITIVAIAAIAAFFYAFIWPRLKSSLDNSTKCANAICDCAPGTKTCPCTYIDEDGKEASVTCAVKNETNNN